ncbi:Spy/CpxP family protein refolding chaperone [Amphibiibacter pelophylacis]|uniref:Spy/CpxP family protein refolding chaperone n=1 Tax=Amphibiibacter pelophylacis TaxID=1799477 RepID=A0ACC6NZQ5_9BURK
MDKPHTLPTKEFRMKAQALPMNRMMKSAAALVAVSAIAFGLATPLTSRAQTPAATGAPLVPPAPGLDGRDGPDGRDGRDGPKGARGHHGHHGGGGLMALMNPKASARLMDTLKLDAAQRSQIQAIQTRMRTQMEAQRAQRKAANGPADMQRQLMTALTQPTVDTAAIQRLQQERMGRMQQMSQQHTQALIDMAQVLTPAQRSQLAGLMQARWDRKAQTMKERHATERGAQTPASR